MPRTHEEKKKRAGKGGGVDWAAGQLSLTSTEGQNLVIRLSVQTGIPGKKIKKIVTTKIKPIDFWAER